MNIMKALTIINFLFLFGLDLERHLKNYLIYSTSFYNLSARFLDGSTTAVSGVGTNVVENGSSSGSNTGSQTQLASNSAEEGVQSASVTSNTVDGSSPEQKAADNSQSTQSEPKAATPVTEKVEVPDRAGDPSSTDPQKSQQEITPTAKPGEKSSGEEKGVDEAATKAVDSEQTTPKESKEEGDGAEQSLRGSTGDKEKQPSDAPQNDENGKKGEGNGTISDNGSEHVPLNDESIPSDTEMENDNLELLEDLHNKPNPEGIPNEDEEESDGNLINSYNQINRSDFFRSSNYSIFFSLNSFFLLFISFFFLLF